MCTPGAVWVVQARRGGGISVGGELRLQLRLRPRRTCHRTTPHDPGPAHGHARAPALISPPAAPSRARSEPVTREPRNRMRTPLPLSPAWIAIVAALAACTSTSGGTLSSASEAPPRSAPVLTSTPVFDGRVHDL